MTNNSIDVAEDTVASSNDCLLEVASSLASDFSFLIYLHDMEVSNPRLDTLREFSLNESIALQSSNPDFTRVSAELQACIESLANAPEPVLDMLAADYAAIYLNYTFHVSPLESIWMDEEDLTFQDAMFDIRGIYKQFGITAENWRMRSEDHLVCQLEFFRLLLESGELTTETLEVLARFYDEHLFLWFDEFARKVEERCNSTFYALVSNYTRFYLDEFRNLLADLLDQPRPSREDVQARLDTRKRDNLEPATMQFMPGIAPSW